MRKRYVVRLTAAERTGLRRLIARGRAPTRQLTHARILLKADQGPDGPAWTDARIVAALDVSRPTVERVRKRCVEEGLDAALVRRPPRATKPRKLDGRQEAHLVALACGTPPEGRRCWTMRLLAERFVALYAGPPISDELVRRTLKKNDLKPWLKERWCIPPQRNAEFVWHLEDVLDVYTRPYDPRRPQVCLDEASKQLLADSRPPLPCSPGHPAREDHEYVRRGTANLFLCYEPLRGWRHVRVTARRTRVDWAHCVKELVNVYYPDAECIVLVQDNLNTHSPASLYEAFPPAAAKRLADRLELHYTPKHGSWLNMAEVELSILAEQCLDRRLPSQDVLVGEASAWEAARNAAAATVDWRFTSADARIKLKHLYPITAAEPPTNPSHLSW